MAISYPLDHPTTPGFRQIKMSAHSVVSYAQSPFTGQQQTYEHQGTWWTADVSLPPMKRDLAAAWIAFLLSLHGRKGWFHLGDSSAKTPRGIATGTPVVNGGSQAGFSLATRGWTASTAGILKAGDYIQVGSYLYSVLVDATSDGSGHATLDIWPRLRSSPSDGASITTSNTKGLFRLTSNDASWDVDVAKIFGISFSAMEYLP